MNDILGRELKDGDLAIGMAIGRDSNGMHIGVIKGSSICRAHKNYNKDTYYLEKSCTSNTYLIANPTQEELVIKERVLGLLEAERLEREAKKAIKTLPLKSLIVGGIYSDVNGYYYLYLGKRNVTITDLRDNETLYNETGNVFCDIYHYKDDNNLDLENVLERIKVSYTCHENHLLGHLSVLKSNKKLVKLEKNLNDEVDFESLLPLVSECQSDNSGYYYGGRKHHWKQVIQ